MWRTTLFGALALAAALSASAQAFVGSMSGSWWDSSRAGEGQFITFESIAGRNVAYLAYFTYDANGQASWHVGNADFAAGASTITIPLVTGSGARFGAAFRSADVRVADAGVATLEFVSCARMRMRHSGMPGAVLDLTRLVGPLAGAGCGDSPPPASSLTGVISGSWWSAARSGEGQFVTFETVGSRNVAYLAYFTYTAEGAATWLVGNADVEVGARTVTIPLVTGSGARFGPDFRAGDVRVTNAGSVTLQLVSCGRLGMSYSGVQSFSHDLARLVGPLTGLGCRDGDLPAAPRAGEERIIELASAHTGFTYPVRIYFPAGYVAGSGNHPVIYAADGETLFRGLVDTVREHRLNAVVVAVGFGDFNRRPVDYTFPGARSYYRFVMHELMPFIETQFRVDRSRRSYVGYSLSGSFAAIAMLLEDPAARRIGSIVSIDGSFWNQTEMIDELEDALAAAGRSLPVSLFFAAAANAGSISSFHTRLGSRGYQGLRMRMQSYGLSHSAVVDPGIVDGLLFVFGGS